MASPLKWKRAVRVETELVESRKMLYYLLNIRANCLAKADNTHGATDLTTLMILDLVCSQQYHHQVSKAPRPGAARIYCDASCDFQPPTPAWYRNNCTKYVTSRARAVSTFPKTLNHRAVSNLIHLETAKYYRSHCGRRKEECVSWIL